MISFQKKLTGYTSISRINKKNQNYNENNEENKDSNPETIMHQIYNKQLNLTPEEEKSWMEGPITKLEMQEQVCFSVNNAKEV